MAEREKKVMGISSPDEQWLAQHREDVLEPELEIIDPHHHLWIHPGHRYLMPELAEDMASGHHIVASVFAECHSMYRRDGPQELRSLGETEFVAGCAAMADSGAFGEVRACQGIVGNVDLTLGAAVEPVFEQHIERAGGRFRGVRFTTAWDASERINSPAAGPELLLERRVGEALAVMSRLQMSLDCWVYHPQLDEVAQIAAAHPDLIIVVNHTGVPIMGGPYKDQLNSVREVWRRGIGKVAAQGNTFIKLGAFPVRKSGDGIDRSMPPDSEEVAAAWGPWMRECIDAFGVERCMFESNFPVQKLWSSYQVTWNAFKRIAADASDAEKRHLFYAAAARAYRLGH